MQHGKNQAEAKPQYVTFALIAMLAIGFCFFAFQTAQLTIKNEQLKQEVQLLTPPPEVQPSESVLTNMRTVWLERCKLNRAVEFYDFREGKLTTRAVTGRELAACVDEAFALNGTDTDNKIREFSRDASRARMDLFRAHFDMCRETASGNEQEATVGCVHEAHDKTVDALR